MSPDTRRLVQLTLEPTDNNISPHTADRIMDMLLAKKRSADRKQWLYDKGAFAQIGK